ncbi:hypothetical protein BD779DRAFT_693191 [Infundibulicybe gibba]|nr:hypothetical protein BD779DRAFT_693191 [Infundibulicybe gibba]
MQHKEIAGMATSSGLPQQIKCLLEYKSCLRSLGALPVFPEHGATHTTIINEQGLARNVINILGSEDLITRCYVREILSRMPEHDQVRKHLKDVPPEIYTSLKPWPTAVNHDQPERIMKGTLVKNVSQGHYVADGGSFVEILDGHFDVRNGSFEKVSGGTFTILNGTFGDVSGGTFIVFGGKFENVKGDVSSSTVVNSTE